MGFSKFLLHVYIYIYMFLPFSLSIIVGYGMGGVLTNGRNYRLMIAGFVRARVFFFPGIAKVIGYERSLRRADEEYDGYRLNIW